MSDDTTSAGYEGDPRILSLVRNAGDLRELVRNTVMLADEILDANNYTVYVNPGLDLTGLAPDERYRKLATDVSGFDTDPEVVDSGNYCYFSILGQAYDLYTALPGLTEDGLARKADEAVGAICAIPEEYVPVYESAEASGGSPAPDEELEDVEVLRRLWTMALIFVSGWMDSVWEDVGPNAVLEEDDFGYGPPESCWDHSGGGTVNFNPD